MTPEAMLETALPYSPFLQRRLETGIPDVEKLSALSDRPLTQEDFESFLTEEIRSDEALLAQALRRLRLYVIAHIMVRDLARVSTLQEVTDTITRFADFAVCTAEAFAHRHYAALYGEPVGLHSGTPQRLSVVGMGKMGGYELNVSSDIDLIFIFPESGETDGKRQKSNQEFFTKVGQKIIALLDNATADGRVFRVDMRLRPDGDSGAIVLSETGLEQYLIAQGREWERYAWIKGRVLTPHANGIEALVRPFVYRKYLDFNAYEAMRGLHRQIAGEVSRKGLADNIKLGAGGIREVEFIVQIFQLIRGGQMPVLQRKDTQGTLSVLVGAGILDADTADTLLTAYRFLRDIEHRLQYYEDLQTQDLPEQDDRRQLLAGSMGFGTYADFLLLLNRHRQAVHAIFDDILADPADKEPVADSGLFDAWLHDTDNPQAPSRLQAFGFADRDAALQLRRLQSGSTYRQLSAAAKQRFDDLIPQILQAAADAPGPDRTLGRLGDLLEAIGRRSAYLALLREYPQALAQVALLVGQSSWVSRYLCRHPGLLDELLGSTPDLHTDDAQTAAELAAMLAEAPDDTETQMDILRRFNHRQIFRLAVADLAGLWTVEALSDRLSALADMIVQEALNHAWADLPKKHCPSPRFAVIGYGKLGGKEMGYASDLDLVYLYDDTDADAAAVYGRLANRLNTWLTAPTGAGALYEIDMRLRPNGESGFLAASLQSFEHYQQEEAWTWEHQALTRARFVGGDPAAGRRFDAVRAHILSLPRDRGKLAADIVAMREKMFPTHPPEAHNVKYARGGIVDVEFSIQYLILAHAREFPQLMHNYGNIALLGIAAEAGLIDTDTAAGAQTAYRHFRRIQHNVRLRDIPRPEPDSELLGHYDNVCRLWEQVFGQVPADGSESA